MSAPASSTNAVVAGTTAPQQTGSVSTLSGTQTTGDLWAQAVASLSEEDKRNINFNTTDKLAILQDVLIAAEEKKRICLDRRWRYKKDGKEIIIRDQLDKVVGWIHKFREVGDVVIQYDPSHAALPWAGVRFFLQLAVSDSQTFGSMAEGMELISNLITRCTLLENLYLKSSVLAVHITVHTHLTQAMCKLYAAVLEYLSQARRYYTRHTIERMTKAMVQPSDTALDKHIGKILKSKSDVDECVHLAETCCNQASSLYISRELEKFWNTSTTLVNEFQKLKHLVQQLEVPIYRSATLLSNVQDFLQAQERRDLIRWLTTIQYENHHKTMGKGVLEDSGEWLFRKKEFLEWRAESWSSILWLRGIPGSGKSKLTCLAIDRFLKEKSANKAAAPIAYFYCIRSTSEPERADPDEIMRSLLKQLSCSGTKLPVRDPLASRYKELKEKAEDNGSQEPPKLNLEECVELILGLLDHNPATIVIDALDECDPLRRHELLLALKDIIQKSANIIKVFVSSRDDNDIVCQLEDTPNVYIRASDNREDITRFINNEVDWSIRNKLMLSGKVSKELKNRIVDTLTEGAQGMFRWVSLQIQNLCDSQRMKLESDIRAELGRLPKSLRESYDVVYQRIKDAGIASQQVAERAVKWLLCSFRPLKVQEMIAAVSVDIERQHTFLDTSQLLDVCCNLLVLDDELDTLRFAHLSVREYFEGLPGYTRADIHVLALERCIDMYISTSILEADAALKNYVSRYLPAHIASLGSNQPMTRVKEKLQRFFIHDNEVAAAFGDWFRDAEHMSGTTDPHSDYGWFGEIASSPPSPLLLLCCTECLWIVHSLSGLKNEYWAVKNKHGRNCLACAAANGSAPMVNIFLQRGIYDVNCYDNSGLTPLLQAADSGHESVVGLLLDHEEIDVNCKDARVGNTPLGCAIVEDHGAIAQMLLAHKGIDVNATNDWGIPSISLAASRDNEFVLRLLLQHKAIRVNLQDEDGVPPIAWASDGKEQKTTRLLLQQEIVDINLKDNCSRTPLAWAVRRGKETAVQLLLEQEGINIDAQDYDGMTPLMKTVALKSDHILRMLLEHNADVALTDDCGRNALSYAVEYGWDTGVRLLLQHGADPEVEVRDGIAEYGTSALAWALLHRQEVISRLLLDVKDDINAQDEDGDTPLLYAIGGQLDTMVRLILGREGINVNLAAHDGQTPIDVAFWKVNETILSLLLDREELDVNPKSKDGRPLLYRGVEMAIKYPGDYEAVLRLLLTHKDLQVEWKDRSGMTALDLATCSGNETLVQILQNCGSKAETEEDETPTAVLEPAL